MSVVGNLKVNSNQKKIAIEKLKELKELKLMTKEEYDNHMKKRKE